MPKTKDPQRGVRALDKGLKKGSLKSYPALFGKTTYPVDRDGARILMGDKQAKAAVWNYMQNNQNNVRNYKTGKRNRGK